MSIPLRSLEYGKQAHKVLELIRTPDFRHEALSETIGEQDMRDSSHMIHRAESPVELHDAYVSILYSYADSKIAEREAELMGMARFGDRDENGRLEGPPDGLALDDLIALYRDDVPMPTYERSRLAA